MQFYSIRAVCAFIVTLFVTGGAFAQSNPEFLRVIQDPSEQQLVLDAAKQAPVVEKNPCADSKFTLLDEFAIYTPLQFSSSGKVTAGAWRQSVSENGCGRQRHLNVLIYFDAPSNNLKAGSLLPGNTHADPILQRDAMMYAEIAAACPEDKNCETIYVTDTKFLQEVGETLEGAKEKPWDELWTLNICGKNAQVTMHFIPDKTGTTIHTSPTETKFLPANQ